MDEVSALEARSALGTVERERLRVVDQIDLPQWYWWSVAVGWIGLGLLADLASALVLSIATFVFGAVHAAVAPKVVNGRRGSRQLSVSADVAGRHIAKIIIGGLVVLGLITIGGSLALRADGAAHPTAITSVFVAIIIVLGGPLLLADIRRRATRTVSAA